ncbi:hypothetical protein TNCV_113031 [Trichonephila clavipes]|nr:hypothetical protein TNCV_113031 [Trichonephila clavipes]
MPEAEVGSERSFAFNTAPSRRELFNLFFFYCALSEKRAFGVPEIFLPSLLGHGCELGPNLMASVFWIRALVLLKIRRVHGANARKICQGSKYSLWRDVVVWRGGADSGVDIDRGSKGRCPSPIALVL